MKNKFLYSNYEVFDFNFNSNSNIPTNRPLSALQKVSMKLKKELVIDEVIQVLNDDQLGVSSTRWITMSCSY